MTLMVSRLLPPVDFYSSEYLVCVTEILAPEVISHGIV